jgi:hypothetical protein
MPFTGISDLIDQEPASREPSGFVAETIINLRRVPPWKSDSKRLLNVISFESGAIEQSPEVKKTSHPSFLSKVNYSGISITTRLVGGNVC